MGRLNLKAVFVTLLGIVVHLIFLYSIFDIYFKSPILHGLPSYAVPLEPPAKRLVLFIADGLRADKFFELDANGQSRAPFLRSIATNRGVWGISHTRVPTESRPGHVALIAGFYEDVSAVAKGWKENPVEFDSVFNQSRFTWSWGSPDIVLMFAKGSAASHVFTETYEARDEDFAGARPSQLDTWVFNKFKKFLQSSKQNTTLLTMISDDRNIFFLHLLGLDTNGHAHNPGSDSYLENVNIVDKGVEDCVNMIEEYFDYDGKTSYIFTSDHGMTDWGTHGAGDNEETHTPFIAWGAGIRGPVGSGHDWYHDGLSEKWNLASVQRVDINQADVAPFISALIGIPFPVNSVGVLPTEYLATEWRHRFLSLKTNSLQILAQYKTKVEEVKETSLIFRQFKQLSPARLAELETMMDVLATQKRYQDAIQVCLKIIELGLKGLDYYQKYDRFILKFAIISGYLGWMCYLSALIFEHHTSVLHSRSLERPWTDGEEMQLTKTRSFFVLFVLSVTIGGILHSLSSPMMYYIYFLMPVFLWCLVIYKLEVLVKIHSLAQKDDNWLIGAGVLIVGSLGIEILVGSFFRRWLLSFGLVIFAMWPLTNTLWTMQKTQSIAWMVTCGIMAVFPFLPVVGRESNYWMVEVSGWLSVVMVIWCARRPEMHYFQRSQQRVQESHHITKITVIQVFMLGLSTYNVKYVADSIATKSGLPLLNQFISWTILVTSWLLPLTCSLTLLPRLLNITVAIMSIYILMCISYEGLFCLGLCVLMFLWMYLEHSFCGIHKSLGAFTFESDKEPFPTSVHLRISDLRRSYFFIFFIVFAFFGTGNIASINSFEPVSVYCFLTVFSPFTMGGLMLLKVMMPFLLVSSFFRALLIVVKIPHQALILIYVLVSDVMGLHFFFMVQDYGSWLDIGTSISHYVISMTITTFVLLLHGLAWVLTNCKFEMRMLSPKRHTL